MKHAYLILAHNHFEVTQLLISCLDDVRNDIYIHVDKKLTTLPTFEVNHSNLIILDDREDVGWGDISLVDAEIKLFEKAQVGHYNYYHLLSGVDIPLKSQDFIHNFFQSNDGKEFIGYSQYEYTSEVTRKVQKFHLFPRDFRRQSGITALFKRVARSVFLKVQDAIGFKRNTHIEFKKGTQWVSVTHAFVQHILANKAWIQSVCHHTFCSDEIYKQTLAWNSDFRNHIYDAFSEPKGCLRMIGWVNGELVDWQSKDYEELVASEYLFARKFNSDNLELVHKIKKHIEF